MAAHRVALSALLLTASVSTSGCTLCKPVVGALTGPVVILGNTQWGGCCCGGNDAYAIVAVLAVMSAVGAVGGLVTGVISDVQVLAGTATDPTRNWADPFKTNTSCDN